MKKVLLLLLVICLTALPCISNTNSHIPMRVMHNRTRVPIVMPDVEQEDCNLKLSSSECHTYKVQIMDENGKIVYDNFLPLSSNQQIITINNSGLYSINLFIGDVEYEGYFNI